MDEIKDKLDTVINYTAIDKYVPEVECNNHTIGERVRVRYHHLLFKTMLRVMLKYLAMVSIQQWNIFQLKGVLEYYSPYVLLRGRPYNYTKDCQVEFGSYVQANKNNNPTNNNEPRTIDRIYLWPSTSIQGGHKVMSLSMRMAIYPRKVTVIPLTESIIKLVEQMGLNQGIKSLTIKSRQNNIL